MIQNEINPGELNILNGMEEGKSKPKKSKYFFFTWETNLAQRKLPSHEELEQLLGEFTGYYAFQLERGEQKGKEHYQGCFSLKKGRTTKKKLLEDVFAKKDARTSRNVAGLTLMPQFSFSGSLNYCTKEETRIEGPWVKGRKAENFLKRKNTSLLHWQACIYSLMVKTKKSERDTNHLEERGVILVEDIDGGSGKTSFIRWLCEIQTELNAYKIPMSNPDRLLSAVTKLRTEDVDVICIDIPRTLSKDVDLEGVFHAVEDLKGGHIVDCMYGQYVQRFLEKPLVLITTNISHKELVGFMSMDRWYIYSLRSIEGGNGYSDKTLTFIKPNQRLNNYKEHSDE